MLTPARTLYRYLAGGAGGGGVDFLPCRYTDSHVLAQALARLAKSSTGLPGGDFEEAAVSARIAREVVVVSSRRQGKRGARGEGHFMNRTS